MTGCEFSLCGETLHARPSGALWWPARRLLCASDLHLGKSERIARRGGTLLPPYETAETLDRLAAEINALDPATVVCLGDSFDDAQSATALGADNTARLNTLMAGRDWVWIAGNHDPGPLDTGGRYVAELAAAPLALRHIAKPGTRPGEISGHYHPKIRLSLKGRSLSRPCFLFDEDRLILPAFGAYTGGLRADDPALQALMAPGARAILTGSPCVMVPLAGPGGAQ